MTAASLHGPAARVRTCPDCGGILQSLDPEPLTSAEAVAADPVRRTIVAQCLICGYEESATRAGAGLDR